MCSSDLALLWSETYRSRELRLRLPQPAMDDDRLARFMAEAMAAGVLRRGKPAAAAEQFKGLLKAQAFWPQLVRGTMVSKRAMAVIAAEAVGFFLSHYGKPGSK